MGRVSHPVKASGRKQSYPQGAKTSALSCPLSATHSKRLLSDPLFSKSWMSLSLSLGSIFGLEAGQLQGLQACGCNLAIGEPVKRPTQLGLSITVEDWEFKLRVEQA